MTDLASSAVAQRPLLARHVMQQFNRRQPWHQAAFVHEEIGQRMLERLRYIKLEPKAVLDAGCGAGWAASGLAERFPGAAYHGIDHSATALQQARQHHEASKAPWWRTVLTPKPNTPAPHFAAADLASTGLAPESVDLVWSNLALHWHPAPPSVFTEWFRVLRPQGLVMFSTYGPATLQELRQAIQAAGLATATPAWIDMHDFGDMLLENGFTDPVMDQETLTLTYTDPAKLLNDVRALGGNPAQARRPGLAGRAFRERLLNALEQQRNAQGQLHLTLEVAYGHAWRATMRRQGHETHIPLSAIGRNPQKPV